MLVISYLVIMVITILGAVFVIRTIGESRMTQKYAMTSQAFWLADAGVQKATWELNHNSCAGMVQCGSATACSSCTSCGGGNKCVAGTLSLNGDYDLTLDNNNTVVTSTGSFPSRSATNKTQRTIQMTIGNNSLFTYAAFAQGSLVINNNALIDSYDSSLGLYGGANKFSNGDVGSNGTTAGIITIDNNAIVKGDASTGVGGSISGNPGQVTGTVTHSNNVTLNSVIVPSSLTGLSNSGSITTSNNGSTAINAGDYKYSNIDLANGSTLTVNGTVNLYLTGATSLTTGNNVNIVIAAGAQLTVYTDGVFGITNNANLNNVNKIPGNFTIYSTYTGSDGISIHNNG